LVVAEEDFIFLLERLAQYQLTLHPDLGVLVAVQEQLNLHSELN
jgi:hypothetical protein